jgi:hypothetical protein
LAVAIGAIMVMAMLKVVMDNTPKLKRQDSNSCKICSAVYPQNITQITNKGAEIVVKFLNAVTSRAPALVAAGVRTLVAFLQGVTSKISTVVGTVANMVLKFICGTESQRAQDYQRGSRYDDQVHWGHRGLRAQADSTRVWTSSYPS